MAFSYVIDGSQHVGVAGLRGRVTASIFCEAMKAMYRDASWVPGMAALWDLRYIEELIILPTDVPEIVSVVDALEPRLARGRAAFVAPHEPAHTMAKLLVYRTKRSSRTRRVFRHLVDALDWLDVTLPGGFGE